MKLLDAYRVGQRHADEVRLDQISSGTKRAAYFEQKQSHVQPIEKGLRARLLRFASECHGCSMAPFVVSGVLANDLGSDYQTQKLTSGDQTRVMVTLRRHCECAAKPTTHNDDSNENNYHSSPRTRMRKARTNSSKIQMFNKNMQL